MGIYLNPLIETEDRYVCVSRPRRFGKTMAAYYGCDEDTHFLFDNLKISDELSYEAHLNKHMVLKETLFTHLWEVQQTCEKRMQLLMEELLLKNPTPDKVTQQLIWVQHMNTLKFLAEEVVVKELIYC